MISTFNSTAQTVDIGGAYVFDTNRIVTGCTVGHVPGTSALILNKPGYYYITFNTTFTTATTGEAIVELQNGGIAVPGANGAETVTTAGDTKSISFTTIVKVLPSCPAIDNTTTLTFVATGIALDATTAAASITKLC
jgi:hypothetical protein